MEIQSVSRLQKKYYLTPPSFFVYLYYVILSMANSRGCIFYVFSALVIGGAFYVVEFFLPFWCKGKSCVFNVLISVFTVYSFLYLQYNFVGRILGPRGLTAKQLEAETGCKIMVRGKSSMRDKKKVCSSAWQYAQWVFMYFLFLFDNNITQ